MHDFFSRTMAQNESKIDMRKSQEISYWTGQWQITPEQLYRAIQETGSNCVREIKEYLRGKGFAL